MKCFDIRREKAQQRLDSANFWHTSQISTQRMLPWKNSDSMKLTAFFEMYQF